MVIGIVVDNEFDDDIRVQNELTTIASMGHSVKVLCLRHRSQALSIKTYPVNVEVFRVFLPRKIKNIAYAWQNTFPFYGQFWKRQIEKFIKSHGINALHVHDLYLALPARKAIKGRSVMLVLDLHENYPEAIRGYKWAMKWPSSVLVRPDLWREREYEYMMSADRIIVLSQQFKNQLCEKYSLLKQEQLVVYPNVPDIKQLLGFPIVDGVLPDTEKPIIFYFGAIAERRGIFTALSAIELLRSKGHDLLLLLVGPVDKAEKTRFELHLKSELLTGSVLHYKWKDISEFPSLVHASSICISPILNNKQHQSGVANKVYQYMLFSKPLIVSDCGPQASIVENCNCGLVFKSEDPVDLAEKISILLADKNKGREMGANGRRFVVDDYNTQKQGQVLIDLYEEIQQILKK